MKLKKNLIVTLKILLVSVIIFSVIYPFLLGGIGQLWSNKAKGSLIEHKGEIVGSKLIGQNFNDPKFFQSRPSSIDYNALKSSSENLAPTNPYLKERVKKQLKTIEENYNLEKATIPANFVTESGSALDPHISPESAYLQVDYISNKSGIEKEKLNELIDKHTKKPVLGLFGKAHVNVLELNLSLKEVMDK